MRLLEEEPMDIKVGMDFSTSEELYDYYGKYGNDKGFPVLKRSSKKGDDGIGRWVIYACARSGTSESNSKNAFKKRPISKTNFSARLNIVLYSDGSLGKSRFYKYNRIIQPFVKRRLEMNDRAGIRPNKSFNSFVVEAGGHDNVPFLEKDCYNHLDKFRRLRLGDGDAAAIQNYFTKMQANNSNFYYLLDLVEEARIKNFGEVVTFDTTYLTNKYDMLFAPFVGVNHHGHSILLGCALISKCMGGRAPNAIITDQARAMKNAIEVVFPNTRHRWCLWHIMKKLPEKLGGYKQGRSQGGDYGAIKNKMKNAVYDSLSYNEFEEKRNLFINKYNLHKNDWLNGLYIERQHWVPVFVKYIFWAGMSTTQRSESMNVFFDGYVNSKTTLKQFVEQYENALRSKTEKENQADFNSFNSWIPCIYTTTKFKEFQNELTGKIYCDVSAVETRSDFMVYEILEDKIGGLDRQNTFTVSFRQSDCDIKCNCRLFEFRGIICRHSVVVLIQQKKRYKEGSHEVKITYFDWMQNPKNEQFDRLCNAFYQVADLATDNKDKVENIIQWIKKLRDDLSENSRPSSVPVSQLSRSPTIVDISPAVEEINKVRSPLAVPKRGRAPFKRKQSRGEQVI
ncbi:hypothetical protein AQUCO_06700032v1 [Aquilegia coerulea]|uniref:SWIM-type domain-containing protein n=1 Tax=Aquilegia coerulea TaxID=218851 RepID=A0A2G5CBR0_AQUCA|nr:hypothetical protein AQUCO_06700032v1 [Aquilegia coerulea]